MILSLNSLSQNNNKTQKKEENSTYSKETLFNEAKSIIDKKNYKDAVTLLSQHYTKFSNSLTINWLYAHALWLTSQEKKAKVLFQKAMLIAPENQELQRDYISFLYQTGRIIALEPILEGKLKANQADVEEKLMLANVYFWRGKINDSKRLISVLNAEYPNSNVTKKLEEEINDLTASYIHVKSEYQEDSQPLKYFANHLKIGEYFSRYFNPSLKISNFRFNPIKEQAFSVELTNDLLFDKVNLKVSTSLGIYNNISDHSDWIGSIQFRQTLFKNIEIQFGYDKNPLLTTIASTKINLTEEKLYGTLNFQNNYLIINAGFHHAFYEDDNYINSIASWILSQPIKIYNVDFQIGYGFNFMDAKEILFFYDTMGNGVYDPYFTPEEQVVHSMLAVINYQISSKFSIEGKLNYGIEATVQNPYPVSLTPNTMEIGGFYNAPFDYKEFVGTMNYKASANFEIGVSYLYQKTFFYDRDNVSLGFNYRF